MLPKAKDLRARARGVFQANYGMMLAGYVVFQVLMGATAAMVGVGTLILGGPLTVGYTLYCLDVSRGGAPDMARLFDGFKNFGNALVLYLTNALLIFAWSLLLLVPGVVKKYSYSMSFYLLADHPDWTPSQARAESMRMMRGNKWRLFCLHLSFFGWLMLSVLTLGVLVIVYVGPYMQQAETEFYLDLAARENRHGATFAEGNLAH